MRLLTPREKQRLLEVEAEVEDRVVFGMCPSLNEGVREAVTRPFTAGMVIDTSQFPYPHHPHMCIMSGESIVGEQILDKARLSQLRGSRDNIFLWENFVVYRNRLPRDMEGRKRLRLLYLARPFPVVQGLPAVRKEVLGVPSAEGDRFLKDLLQEMSTEIVLGTSLVGFYLE